jgi:hypothetical protein
LVLSNGKSASKEGGKVMENPCARCPTPECYMTECDDYKNYIGHEEIEADRRRLKQFQIDIKEGFCANYDELFAKCIKQYKKDYKQTNELMIQGMQYYNEFLKNNEQGDNT